MHYSFYILGLAPSLIWLWFYLKKDKHPESNWMVITTFLAGMAIALVALILELSFEELRAFFDGRTAALASSGSLLKDLPTTNNLQTTFSLIAAVFIGGALVEEYMKYKAAKLWMNANSDDVDEPTDMMVYPIIAALGFAAMENIMVLHNQQFNQALTTANALTTMGWRFISATFLHALSSGLIGFFLALSIYKIKKRKRYLLLGLLIGIVLHGLYNWSIMEGGKFWKLAGPLIILLSLSIFVSYGFQKLKTIKSTCLIKNN